ncbi:MAG: bifunctional 5,10-methylenetetrahydrofolate dehydrogenase/5,10-methenyltetrahydrofolate cyclohydrolase [Elusimicrobiaceae bacterium]|nr:bifunctional 5,10-methylenetetrahydrofolate dehydrogenase/5,10-methenyltetrahydrofolate cyclohydrolase [Elusimicrobiaceae bacterium]
MANILEGKTLAKQIKASLQERAYKIYKKMGRRASLVGFGWKGDAAGFYYLNKEVEAARKIGIDADIVLLENNTKPKQLFTLLDAVFQKSTTIDALLIARPLPPQLNNLDIAANINPAQDIDGAGLISMGRLFMCKTWQDIENLQTFIPCCPKAVVRLLDYHKIKLEGAKIAVIGRSNTVGSPLAKMLTAKNAVVTLCHTKTKDLREITLNSDIIVSAAGKINLIKKDFAKKGTILIDVATVVNEQGKCVGDIDFENLKEICPISPVPGGVGPVTLACLLENIIISAERKIK